MTLFGGGRRPNPSGKNSRRAPSKFRVAVAVLSIFMVVVIILLTLLAVRVAHLAHENRVAMAAEASGDSVLLTDPSLGKIRLPLLRGVDRCKYHSDDFYLDEKGRLAYDSKKCTATLGIDVSTYQRDVDWDRVREDGVEFVMVRAGFRGYGSEGRLVEDESFRSHVEGASAAGLHVGVYFFSQATTVEEAEEEAAFVLERLKGLDIDYPVVFDWEIIDGEEARTDGMLPDEVTDCAAAFCKKIKRGGYTPMVYFSTRQGLLKYNLRDLRDYDFWLVQYTNAPYFAYDYKMLQFTETGIVDGLDGYVDLDLCFKKY